MSTAFQSLSNEATFIADGGSEGSPRILIVDDEESVRKMFSEYLSDSYECFTAASTEEALAHLAVRPFSLMLSDMIMPGRSGIELLREVTAKYPDTAVIMVSAIDRPQRVRDALRVGAFDYLIKPCEMEALQISVERALERKALEQMARKYKADLENQNDELTRRKAELERLQAQIVHSEKMASLGQLAAGIAHELNNPAGFVYGNIDLLKGCLGGLRELLTTYDNLGLSPDVARVVESIKSRIKYESLMGDLESIISDCLEGSGRIRDVVQNLRLFSRLDEAEIKKIDIHAGIDSTIRLLSRYFSAGTIRLRRDYGNLPLVSCYAGQLNQVWLNLLANAAQAVGDSGEVAIMTRVDGNSVVVSIRDTGCGIPSDQLERIFDPFFTTKPVGEGTGLGLSTSYGIVKRHGGIINVESRLGAGTAFTVRIPTSLDTE